MPERAVVTGAGGFIGRRLVDHLVAAGTSVTAVDRRPLPFSGCRLIERDVSVPGALDDLVDAATTVFHLASPADVAGSVAEPARDLGGTFSTLFQTLETVRRIGGRMVFASTASIFDPAGDERPRDERSFPRPSSPYAAAKLAGEAYCYAYHRAYGLDVKVARMFSVYGEGMRRFAIYDLVEKIRRRPPRLEVLGDGEQVRDYLHVSDAARGLVLIAERGAAGEDYNLASGEPVRVIELARALTRLMDCPELPIVPTGESFPGDVKRFYADIAKITALGFAPRVPLAEGLARTVAWITGESQRQEAS